jgi:aminoglycoside 6-adenylyltransferase
MTGSPLRSRTDYELLCLKVVEWARTQSRIQAILLVGSRARMDPTADHWSDLDLMLFIHDPAPYQEDWTWLSGIGDVLLHARERTGHGDSEWLVLFANGLKGDFALVNIPDRLAGNSSTIEALLAATNYYKEVYQRGVICLLDKSNPQYDNQVISWHKPQDHIPSQEDFGHLIHHFLIDAHRAAKYIRRGDLWRSQQACNEIVTRHLLSLAEWHAHAIRGPVVDTWYDGRFIEEWADRRFIEALPNLFGEYNPTQLSRALQESLSCFEWLSRETAAALHLDYPDHTVTQSLRLILSVAGS